MLSRVVSTRYLLVIGLARSFAPTSYRKHAPQCASLVSYEWDQADDGTVDVRFTTQGLRLDDLDVVIETKRILVTSADITLIDGELTDPISPDDSFWALEGDDDDDDDDEQLLECCLYKRDANTQWQDLFVDEPELGRQRKAPQDEEQEERPVDLGRVDYATTEGARLADPDAQVFEFENMEQDAVRTEAFRKAIAARVSGKTVVEIGTGALALLALMAAEAGARKVYAIEVNAEAASLAKKAVAAAGLSDVIEVIQGLSTDVELPERCDLILSELAGHIASGEGAAHCLRDAKTRFLKEQKVAVWSIPAEMATFAAPVRFPEGLKKSFDDERNYIADLLTKMDPSMIKELEKLRPDLQGEAKKFVFKLSDTLLDSTLITGDREKGGPLRGFPLENVLGEAKCFESLRFDGEVPERHAAELGWRFDETATFDGFILFNALSCGEIGEFEISSFDGASHWQPIVVQFPRQSMRAGDTLHLETTSDVEKLRPTYTFAAKITTDEIPVEEVPSRYWDVAVREAKKDAAAESG